MSRNTSCKQTLGISTEEERRDCAARMLEAAKRQAVETNIAVSEHLKQSIHNADKLTEALVKALAEVEAQRAVK
jgi:hypothetical protein